MAKRSKGKPPSRVRYEEMHPTVSFRVSKDIYETGKMVTVLKGLSYADVFNVGLGTLKVPFTAEVEARKQGFDLGYKKGYADAQAKYVVSYPCSLCGKTLTVTIKEEKDAIRQFMRENGWSHSQCP